MAFAVVVAPKPITGDCGICYEPLKENAVIHTGENGNRHPYCKPCLTNWLRQAATCPSCQVALDTDSVFSWKDKAIVWLKSIKPTVYTMKLGGWSFLTSILALSLSYMEEGHKANGQVTVNLSKCAVTILCSTLTGLTAGKAVIIDKDAAAMGVSFITSYWMGHRW